MTSLNTTRHASSGRSLGGLLTNAYGTLAAWNDARATRKALNCLSNRELEDIGLCRSDIEGIATKTTTL